VRTESPLRIFIVAVAIALLAVPAHAQGMRGGKKQPSTEQKTDTKKKTDDKDYRSAVGTIPDKPSTDPWKGVR
jgi:hypothetical protein